MGKSYQTDYDTTYCYPGTHVLRNKLDIRDQNRLHDAERDLTSQREFALRSTHAIPQTFDEKHLCAIHRYLFSDLYDWAGKYRTVDIAKGELFCRPMFIEDNLRTIFTKLRKENCLENTNSKEQTAERLAYYLSELNAVHPFREGNGRTQRNFIQQLASHAGYVLTYAGITEREMTEASVASFYGDYKPMADLFKDRLEQKPDRTAELDKLDERLEVSRTRTNDLTEQYE